MKKVVILGCENSHADTFLNLIRTGNYPEIEVVGVYSDDRAAAEKLNAAGLLCESHTPTDKAHKKQHKPQHWQSYSAACTQVFSQTFLPLFFFPVL